ncbi:MAG: N-acetylneuraminate synthase [Synergistaceae bacterium]|nr:N-acetylneuraminate synthase [Synergistaceae bacterium]
MSILIIAEAGVNHNGDVKIAKRLIDEAKRCGAGIVKFQTGNLSSVVSKTAQKADYQKRQTGSDETQYEMIKKLLLSREEFICLSRYCKDVGITFLSTPFDIESIHFLNTLDMPFWKIPSGEITNLPYLIEIAKTGKEIVLSTGMSTIEEIAAAIDVLNNHGAGAISLLHCTTEYPAPIADVNLKAMETMRKAFNLPVGYSDHTQGIEIPIAAAAMGAAIIEKHFTLDRNMNGPDHKASLEPDELQQMIRVIRNVELATGNGDKRPVPSEIKNIAIARKSIIAKRDIAKGETFSEDNITTKRPGNGINPMRWFEVLGQRAIRDFAEDELIEI